MKKIAFIDIEVGGQGKILDLGAIKGEQSFHSAKVADFVEFVNDCEYLCGHNIIEHDLKYLRPFLKKSHKVIDTLYLSPLLFPMRPYHRLLKNDKYPIHWKTTFRKPAVPDAMCIPRRTAMFCTMMMT